MMTAVLSTIRRWRVQPDRAAMVTDPIRALMAGIERSIRKHDQSLDAWAATVPDPLRAGVRMGRRTRDALTVHAPSAPARFQLDRWLRAGGQSLLSAAGVPKVIVRVGG